MNGDFLSLEHTTKLKALIRSLAETERQLQELVSDSQVGLELSDQALHQRIKTLLAHVAESEHIETRAAILDALSSHIALIDVQGVIIEVNEAWRTFAHANAFMGSNFGAGENYLEVCENATGECAEEAAAAGTGIRAVLQGRLPCFTLDYPCHSTTEERWFRLTVTPLQKGYHSGAVVAHTNITESRKAKQSIQESEEHFRATFEQAAMGIAHVGLDGGFLRVNEKLCAITGFSREELLAKNFADLTLPGDLASSREARRALLAGEKSSYTAEKRYLKKNGGVVWVNVVTRPLRDSAGSARYFISFFEDISDRKRAEGALRASEGKLRAIFEAEPDCVKLLDTDGMLHDINVAGLQMIEAESFSGQSLLRIVLPDDREKVTEMINAVSLGEKRTIQYRIVGLKGTPRWVEMSGAPFYDEEAGKALVLGVSQDITERKLAEEKIQRLNRLYAVSSSVNEAIVRIPDTQELYEHACRIAVEKGELMMAWVGLAQEDEERIIPVAHWGHDDGYLDSIKVTNSPEQLEGMGPGGQAFRTGAPASCNDIAADTTTFASKREALSRGFRSCAAFPLKIKGQPVGVLAVYGDQPNYFDSEEMRVLHSLAEDISFAIESHQREKQRAQIEEALKESEERYRDMVQLSPDMIFINRDHRIEFINVAGLRLLGAESPEQIIGKSPLEIFHPECHNLVQERIQKLMTAPCVVPLIEEKLIAMDGRLIDVEVAASSHLVKGSLIIQVVCRDITERKQAEEQLRASEDRLSNLVESLKEGLVICDERGMLLHWNRASLAMHGFTATEDGKGHLAELPRIFELETLGGELLTLEQWPLSRVLRGETVSDLEFRVRRLDIEWERIFSYSGAQMMSKEGQSLAFVAMTDITERKKIEEQLKTSFREVSDLKTALDEHAIVATTDPSGKITYVNDKFCAISKFKREDLIGKDHRIINSGYHSKEFISNLWDTIQAGLIWKGELKNKASDGSHYWVDTTIVPFLNKEGKPAQYIAIRTDVTERKRLELVALDRIAELARSNSELEQFAYVATHDLQEPLRAVTSCVQLLQKRCEGKLDERSIEFITHAVDGTKRMQTLIDDLLEYSRVSLSAQSFTAVDCSAVLQGALTNLSVAIRESSTEVTYDPLPVVAGNQSQLGQLFQNLIANALKFHSDSPPKIHISVKSENGAWIFSVKDNGIGMEEQYFQRIFRVFQRLHTRKQYRGTGIGLAICKKVVDIHGGRIWVESIPGNGSTFYFTIPQTNTPL